MAEAYGIKLTTLSRRMSRKNLTAEQAVLEFTNNAEIGRPVVFNGEEYPSISSLAEKVGVVPQTLARMIRLYNWPSELCVFIIKKGMKTRDLHYYEGNLYSSFEDLCQSFGFTYNDVTSAMNYHGISKMDAFERVLERKNKHEKQARTY